MEYQENQNGTNLTQGESYLKTQTKIAGEGDSKSPPDYLRPILLMKEVMKHAYSNVWLRTSKAGSLICMLV